MGDEFDAAGPRDVFRSTRTFVKNCEIPTAVQICSMDFCLFNTGVLGHRIFARPGRTIFKMNALTQLRRVDSNMEAGDALANRRRMLITQPPPRKERKESTSLDARVRSLKVLALTLSREIENLEAQNAPGIRGALDLQTEVRRFEAEIIRSALIQTRGRQRPAARLLGMKPTTLNSKVKRYRIDVKEEADESKEQRHGR